MGAPVLSSPSVTDIRLWYGFVNQLAPFLATAALMEPFRDLLKKSTSKNVYWDSNLQERFRQAQEAICKLAKDGLAEAGYAAVEGEALAVTWCLKKARLLLLGCPNLLIVTDHLLLVKLLGDRELKDILNPRLFRLKEKTLQYRFQRVKEAASKDPVYQLLAAKVAVNDWRLQKAQEVACLRQFYSVRDRLFMVEDLIVYTYEQGCPRLLIPEELRRQVITGLHAGYQGVDSMLRRARQSVYWPGMEGDLQSTGMDVPLVMYMLHHNLLNH
ncbi:uncharacterized protein [Macrobrachium rosenbergii]|uniref:uncharacterized protein n=1 Tax=Macrobrachium rosenbergii TaxID=79674 RepID=UPI0034D63ED4